MDKNIKEKLETYAEKIEKESTIDRDIYEKYNIKRGLRNKNGTGVLVGVTKVGDVCGYEIKDGEKIPAEGELFYRGYPITKIVRDVERTNRLAFEEVIYILLFNKLPKAGELEIFKDVLADQRKAMISV